MIPAACVVPLILLCAAPQPPIRRQSADVFVYSATPAGVAAAISAAKAGREVVLAEPTHRIGGLTTCGLSHTDFRSFEALTGTFREFAGRVEDHYRRTYGPDSPQALGCFRGTHAEPKVNLLVMEAMLAEHPRITVLRRHTPAGVVVGADAGGRRPIVSVRLAGPDGAAVEVSAKVFIDAGYEGDLLAAAGEPFHVGRESRAHYGESLAGDEAGRADGQVQGYNFRLVMTDVPGNRLPPLRPDGYDRAEFAGVLPLLADGTIKKVFAPGHDGIYRTQTPRLPNGKCDVNDTPHARVRLSMPDINNDWPTGGPELRREIFDRHVRYNIGLLYFLQTDPEVPEAVRNDAAAWGFCKDEFADSGHLPPQLYIREARRLLGQHVFVQSDTDPAPGDARARLHPDSIAVGDYIHNCHGTGRSGPRYGGRNTGEFYKPCPPYQIPYGVIVPARTSNLLVPVAVSSSHVGFCALRLEPIWTNLGQAAGWAADLAIRGGVAVQEVRPADIQRKLHADGAATIYFSDVPPGSPDFAAAQHFGTRGGFHGLAAPTADKPKSLGGQYCEAFPGHAAELDRPVEAALLARWVALLPEPRRAGAAASVSADGRTTRREALRRLYAMTGE